MSLKVIKSPETSGWNWISKTIVNEIHDDVIKIHGGATGIRDGGLLESALTQPVNKSIYGHESAEKLACSYAEAIIQNHPFVDGNKRVAAVLLELFLELNNLNLFISDEDLRDEIINLAADHNYFHEFEKAISAHVI